MADSKDRRIFFNHQTRFWEWFRCFFSDIRLVIVIYMVLPVLPALSVNELFNAKNRTRPCNFSWRICNLSLLPADQKHDLFTKNLKQWFSNMFYS